MFCSNCGKSLKSDALICPSCGMTVGESRFDSSRGYTGAQTRLKPGQAV
ncbi:MAG: zinc-ribbon domain-containing protein, partial [Clostridia bacterium]|nr:zinc-ribbon domain-containing protein [Clostridia bacterium]